MQFKRMILVLTIMVGGYCYASDSTAIPHLEKAGDSTRLVVDGEPFLVLGGELHNSSGSSLEYMQPIWPKLVALNLNTVVARVSWELSEPDEGRFDFALVDGLIRGAGENHLRLILLWFGSWKNSGSTYDPVWVKTDLKRFPRAQDADGNNLDTLSTFSKEAQAADARAFAALMKHVRVFDGSNHTVLMVQVENEVGILGPSRDHSPAAYAAWNSQVPQGLLTYLQAHKNALAPELLQLWASHEAGTTGTGAEVFGNTHAGQEVFMAWQYAQYVDAVAAAGKAEYAIPMYVNGWLVQYEDEFAGQYPSGGPVSRVHDIWRAGSSHLDFLSPDIYLADFRAACANYSRGGNPLFIPEARNSSAAASNALYAFGHRAFGFSPFAIEDLNSDHPLGATYKVIGQLAPIIVANSGSDRVAAVVQQSGETKAIMVLGGYTLMVDYHRRSEEEGTPPAAAIIVQTGADEFVAAGFGLSIRFVANSTGPRHVEILQDDEGSYVNGRWVAVRRLNGDETNGGNIMIFRERPIIQKIRLFRHD